MHEMTSAERVDAVASLGFTERQAGFLVTVLLHGGVCVARQYCRFASIARGEKTHQFFGRLVAKGYATSYPHAHGKALLYHVGSKTLYRAIGQPDSRYRRPVPIGRAIERLMVLDAVLAEPGLRWLATEQEKVDYFIRATTLKRTELPHLAFGEASNQTTRYFPDKLPIGIDSATGCHIFLYLVTRPVPIDFRPFLHRHAGLLRALGRWTLRLIVPTHRTRAIRLYQHSVVEELASPLRPEVTDELRWYFHSRRQAELTGTTEVADARFQRAHAAFSAPRFRVLYRSWLKDGDQAFYATVSPALADALNRQTGRVEPVPLAHTYLHLASLVGTL